MRMRDNRSLYKTILFPFWAQKKGLIREERFLIERFLDPRARTLDAGTGGGRIALEMAAMGFADLHAFDYIPEFVRVARQRDVNGKLQLSVQDACRLCYPSDQFRQATYLQQVLCFIETAEGRTQAVREAFRVLQPGGVALFSFLSFDVRRRSAGYRAFLAYLRLVRMVSRSKRSIQYMPWLRLGGFNWPSLVDAGPYVYWYWHREVVALLQSVGFCVKALGTSSQIARDKLCSSLEELERERTIAGMLYLVCSK